MGDDDDARVILGAMQDRIVRGPHVALDVEPDATPDEIRAAFHTLAKQYHPARFGRMSADTRSFANEIFLGLRNAHDSMAKQAGRGTTATGVPAPPRRRDGTDPPPSQRHAVPARPVPQRQTGPVPMQRPAYGSTSPTTNIGPAPVRAPSISSSAPGASGTGPRPLPPRVATPASSHGAPVRPTPPGPLPVPSGARTTGPVPVVRPTASPIVGRTPTGPISQPVSGTRPPGSNPRIMSAIELLNRQQWAAAQAALQVLAREQPSSTQVAALLSYAAGRQAQIERRLDEARVELQRALQLDPDLALAKTALAELFARRK